MIWLVLLLSLIVRLIGLNQSLWLDEADNIVAAKTSSFVHFITQYPIGDFHPPGYFALLWIWGNIFGWGEINIRLLSVILGLVTVWLVYLIGKQLFDKKIALAGALLMGLSPLHIYYSQEARMYSFAAFATSLSWYFLLKILQGKKWASWGYIFSLVLILYSDYVTYLVIIAQLIFIVWVYRDYFKKFLYYLFISGIFLLPWLMVFPQQFLEGREASVNLPGWKKVAGGADLKNVLLVFVKIIFGRINFENRILYFSLSAGAVFFYGIIISQALKKIDKYTKLLLIWLLVPFICSFIISFLIPFLSYFRMIFILPAFYLLVSKGIFSFKEWVSLTILIICIFSSVIFIGIFNTNPIYQREDWRQAAAFLDKVSPADAIILFEDNHVKFPYLYYSKNLSNAYPGLKKIEAQTIDDVNDLTLFLNGRLQIYLFEYLIEITDPSRTLIKVINNLGFKETNVYNFNGVGLIREYQME